MTKFTLPHQMKLVEGIAPAADAAGRSSDIVSLKNVGKAYILIHLTQGNAATIALTPMQAQDVAGTGAKVLANAVPIWSNLDTSLTDTLIRRTDAVNYTTDAAVKNKQVVFEIDPALLDMANGFDCLYFTTGASNAANITQAEFLLVDLRYQQTTPPSAIID
ncbi:hypothetical protein [Mesorhizobium sp. B2-6-1]|uniref:hypothetical protein n=1 Tax=Mesorhizobium sp. B2-6-1 TaxID=2589916 RepID=UPI00112CCD7B|nr:hypothetical protein [Mesorhizobium sp. B2-6-1]TPJ60830.1 hypothetical protein FJ443_20020 [Mesorhizobium sp. B2-6-1]